MMQQQLHISTVPNLVNRVAPVANRLHIKPMYGLWTSTYNTVESTSAWVDWCRSEEFGTPDACNWFVLTPKKNVRVYSINAVADLRSLLDQYPHPDPMSHALSRFVAYLDFERIAQDYDALHMTDVGQWATRNSEPGLNGWDCESTLWFRWCFGGVERVK
jgi:hypothetical protein